MLPAKEQATSEATPRVRMSGVERREQLIKVARGLFAENGVDATSVEEIAAAAAVSKPIVYEHFGSKDGLYAVIVDREAQRLDGAVCAALDTPNARYRETLERGILALLDYIDDCPEGFRILSRDSRTGTYASILSDVTIHAEEIMRSQLSHHRFDPELARPLAQALVGLVSMAGQAWLETRQPPKDVLAAQLVNLAWNGLAHLQHHPTLTVR
ncbi:MAG: TetR/AcrR family transcriptional regulator [Propionibacteriaceae bacterium]|nr:TetR/AcrR family transcriptional regulator [Propionibacteriaceae bacterium]